MKINESIPTTLNDQQVIMLRLLKKPLPNEDFMQMQRLALNYWPSNWTKPLKNGN